MKVILLILILAIPVLCNEKRITDYCTPNDGIDDSACFQNAVDDITELGGGTIIFSPGKWNIENAVSFVTYTKINNSIVLRGSKGAVILPDVESGPMLVFGNQNQVIIEDLVFVGDRTKDPDVGTLIRADFVRQLRIDKCQFIGLRASDSLLYFTNVDTVIRDTGFGGNASGTAIIEGNEFTGLSVSDSEFIDYGHFNGDYYSKTPMGNPAWIKLTVTGRNLANAGALRAVSINNVRFDEGALWGIDATGLTYLSIMGIMQNVSQAEGAGGIKLTGVKYAEIKMSKFGYSTNARPAVMALNKTTVYMDGVTIGDRVYYGVRDDSSKASFNPLICATGCDFALASVAGKGITEAGRGIVEKGIK